MTYSFTSESVSEGHPDKVADQISDAVLDAYLTADPDAKLACECLITTGRLIIAGEAKTKAADIHPIEIAKETLQKIGYDNDMAGFNCHTADYMLLLHEQSAEINQSVAHGGAGDQGLMFGYACNETPELMPLPITLAHSLVKDLAQFRKSGKIPWLLPDAKSQVTVTYENGIPKGVERVVISSQHFAEISQEEIRETLTRELILPITEKYLSDGKAPNILINPSGSFITGGPHGDTGLTGRKIIVDTYGGSCPHGGGAFSGKDPSKVDRSAAYAARYVAKHVVAAGIAEACTVQISYAIGKEDPTSLYINLHESKAIRKDILLPAIKELFDLKPNGIIRQLGLKNPIYLPTAAYGHFGKPNLPWEIINTDIINNLKNIINK
jgi:S-adenosylmethionine synthetase